MNNYHLERVVKANVIIRKDPISKCVEIKRKARRFEFRESIKKVCNLILFQHVFVQIFKIFMDVFLFVSLRKHAYSNILKIYHQKLKILR